MKKEHQKAITYFECLAEILTARRRNGRTGQRERQPNARPSRSIPDKGGKVKAPNANRQRTDGRQREQSSTAGSGMANGESMTDPDQGEQKPEELAGRGGTRDNLLTIGEKEFAEWLTEIECCFNEIMKAWLQVKD